MCALSPVRIPAPVPFTLQTFGVYFALLALGARRGTLATLIYLLLGLFGLPVFAGGAGIGALLAPTGGYLAGLVLLCLVFGLCAGKNPSRGRTHAAAALATLSCYLCGALWYSAVSHTSLLFALWVGAAPFLLPDLIKYLLAHALALRLALNFSET